MRAKPSKPTMNGVAIQEQSVNQKNTESQSQPITEEKVSPDPATQCPVVSEELDSFFRYLDEQPYIQDYQFEKGISLHFKEILAKLFSNPPVVRVANNDLLGQMKNMAHFYRVLGSKDIFLAKDYLANEEGRIENDFDTFYQWLQLDSCHKQHTSLSLSLPLPALYDYAAYFLTSAGGKSYLFRRKQHVALVVQYYCILVVDQANKVGLNHYDIDLAPLIDNCLARIQQSTSLQKRSDYLQTLQGLHEKYVGIARKKL
ncbi:MAG: hypothetical protein P8130_01175 [Deltaproteobacteria bacterium]